MRQQDIFISITKPGIIFGNMVTLTGGYFLGMHGHFYPWLFFTTLLGMALIIASGCVFNNYIDRDIDSLMERTQNRVLVTGLISGKTAIIYASLLGILGFILLVLQTNLLTVTAALVGCFVYVVIYSLFLKRRSTYGITLGGFAGAVPPVVGYCAITNRFDAGAILLFLILFLWQMPHFYAIAIYRLKDFSAAAIPTLPNKKSIQYTKISMLTYIVAFTLVSVLPTFFGYTGFIYLITAACLGGAWFYLGFRGLKATDNNLWARKMFIFSIINITVLCLMMAVK